MFSNLTCKSPILKHCFFKQSKPFLRTTSLLPVKSKKLGKSVLIDKSQFRIVYDFPYITYTVALIRSRISVPILFGVGACYIYISEGSVLSSLLCLAPGCIHGLLAFLFSFLARNIVGKVYVNKEGVVSDVLFSMTDRFGNRIDKIHKIDNLINCDYPNSASRSLGFIKIAIENSDISYKINVRNCKLIDPAVCDHLFGQLCKINPTEKGSTDKSNVDDKIIKIKG